MTSSCNTEYVVLEPRYISVERKYLLFAGVGNPDDPYDYESIYTKVAVAINDVQPPYGSMIHEYVDVDVDIYPCGPTQPIKSKVKLSRSICSLVGNFEVMLFRMENPEIFSQETQFFGIDQIVSYSGVDSSLPNVDDYTTKLKLISDGDFIGYTGLYFLPNQEGSDKGRYFFYVWPEAKIVPKVD